MLRQNSKRLCKCIACLTILGIVCYSFERCEDFVPVLFKKLDGFTEQFNKVLPQLNAMLQSRLNYTGEGKERNRYNLRQSEDESYPPNTNDYKSGKNLNEHSTFVKIHKPSKDYTENKRYVKGNNAQNQSDFIKMFAKITERQNSVAERRSNRFEKLLKNFTRFLVDFHEKKQFGRVGFGLKIEQAEENQKSTSLGLKKATDGEKNESMEHRYIKNQAPTKQSEITRTKEPTIRGENNIVSNPAPLKKLYNPSIGLNKSAETLSKSDLVVPNGIPPKLLKSDGDYPRNETENWVQSREKSATFKPPYTVLTTKANKTGRKSGSINKRKVVITENLTLSKLKKLLMSQRTLNRLAEVFLQKIKKFGLSYNESFFHYKKQPNSSVFYRVVLPVATVGHKLTIFLLHDSKYDSKIWLSIGTFYALATHGYKVIALDLPGYGKSKSVLKPSSWIEKLRFIVSFMLALSPKGPRVLVSPGESGVYSVPVVMRAAVILKGLVFISTTHTGKYSSSMYEKVLLPALVIHGENDTTVFLEEFLESMQRLPNSERANPIRNAGHDCYIEQPDMFHELMNEFLLKLLQGKKVKNHGHLSSRSQK